MGGGSSHDCGKGVGLLIANGGKIHNYEGVDKSTKPMFPYIAVNTTGGTASEMTRFCIITDTSRKDYLQFSVMRTGEVTSKLHSLSEGDQIGVRAPFGNFSPPMRT